MGATGGGEHLASDVFRVSLVGDLEDHSRDDEVARAFDRAVLAAIRAGGAVVVENGANARRGAYRLAAAAAGVPTRVVVFENWDEARAWAAARVVPALSPEAWEALADEARAAAAAVGGEGWDEVVRVAEGGAAPEAAGASGPQADAAAGRRGDAAAGQRADASAGRRAGTADAAAGRRVGTADAAAGRSRARGSRRADGAA